MLCSYPSQASNRYLLCSGSKGKCHLFDRKSGREEPWTDTHWIYNLRTNLHFTLKENPLSFEDLKDFIKSYNPENRRKRSATERFKPYKYEDLIKRDKVCLDIFWIKDKSLEDSENFLEPDVIAGAIAVFKLQSSNFQGYMKISKRNEGYILYLVIWITQNKDSVKEGEEQPHDAGPPISNILLFGIIFFFNFSCFSPEKLRRKKGGEK